MQYTIDNKEVSTSEAPDFRNGYIVEYCNVVWCAAVLVMLLRVVAAGQSLVRSHFKASPVDKAKLQM